MMADPKRRVLGKGLGSLIPDVPEDGAGLLDSARGKPGGEAPSTSAGVPVEVPLARIRTNPHQPRRVFKDGEIHSLADSIRINGVLQPVLLKSETGGGFILIAGERRLRAAKLAGLETIPAVLKDLDEDRFLEVALIENIQREDLGPIETAKALRQLVRDFHLTQAEVASRLGKPRTTVTNFLRLLELPVEVQELLDEQKLDMGHGRALAGLTEPVAIVRLARAAVEQRWSVREVEERVRRLLSARKTAESTEGRGARKDPNVAAAEQALSQALSAKISIHQNRTGRGRIEIRFADGGDLERLYRALLKTSVSTTDALDG